MSQDDSDSCGGMEIVEDEIIASPQTNNKNKNNTEDEDIIVDEEIITNKEGSGKVQRRRKSFRPNQFQVRFIYTFLSVLLVGAQIYTIDLTTKVVVLLLVLPTYLSLFSLGIFRDKTMYDKFMYVSNVPFHRMIFYLKSFCYDFSLEKPDIK